MTAVDEMWMQRALLLAEQAAAAGDVPVGAVVVKDHRVIATGQNRRERDQDPTAHAEVLALRGAAAALGHWRLLDCTLYVTLEPCFMCAGALVNARLPRLVFGATDEKAGAVSSLAEVCNDARLNHRVEVVGGVLADASSSMLKTFFRARRKGAASA